MIDNLVQSIRNTPVSSKSDFITLLQKAVSSVESDKTPAGGGGGGAGGGGGGGSSSGGAGKLSEVSGIPSVPVADETNNNVGGFKDFDEKHWSYDYVMALSRKRVINGYEDGRFCPENFVTRAEFIKMIMSAIGEIDENAVCEFTDVKNDDWFRAAVATGYQNNIVAGNDGLFRPYDNISRQEAVTIIYRQLMHTGISLEKIRSSCVFADGDEIEDYAKEAVDALYKCGIIDGVSDKEFKPFDECTRAQAAKLIYMAFCK